MTAGAIVESLAASLQAEAPGPVVVAVSGGVDSMALLHAAATAGGRRVVAAHLDHGTRTRREHARDRRCVERCARRLHVSVVCGTLDPGEVARTAAQRRAGQEEAARMLRYRFLYSVCAQCGADLLLTGHTADDQAETVLMRLAARMEGTALAGIPVRAGRPGGPVVLRPLLAVSRGEIERYARRHRLVWSDDSTNRSTAYRRNLVRNLLLPELEQWWPALRADLVRLAAAHSQLRDAARQACADVRWLPHADGLAVPADRFFGLPRDARLELLYRVTALLGALDPADRPGHRFFAPLLGPRPAAGGVRLEGRGLRFSIGHGQLLARRVVV